jgi:hypothetical protein
MFGSELPSPTDARALSHQMSDLSIHHYVSDGPQVDGPLSPSERAITSCDPWRFCSHTWPQGCGLQHNHNCREGNGIASPAGLGPLTDEIAPIALVEELYGDRTIPKMDLALLDV